MTEERPEAPPADPNAPDPDQDPAAPEVETPATPDLQAENAALKARAEDAERRLAEQERDRRTREQPGTPATEAAPRTERLSRLRERISPLAPTDPLAAVALELMDEIEERDADRDQKTADAFTLSQVPENQRGPLVQFYQRNRGHFGSLAAARDAFNTRTTEAENAKLRKRVEELEKGGKRPQAEDDEDRLRNTARTTPPPSAGGGRSPGGAPPQKATPMTRDEFDAKVQELYDAGQAQEARAMQRQLREHQIVLRR